MKLSHIYQNLIMFNFEMRSELTKNQSFLALLPPSLREFMCVRCMKQTIFGKFVAFLHIYVALTVTKESFDSWNSI